MKNTVRFIFCVFAITLSFSLLSGLVQADYLIKPIPDEIKGSSVSFGQLLAQTHIQNQELQGNVLGESKVNDFLARLEDLRDQSWEEFNNNPINNEDNPQPTTYIPVPTLIAGVHEIIQNNPITSRRSGIHDAVIPNNSETASGQLSNNPISTNLQSMINTGDMEVNPVKSTYIIAVLGDSMVDTLGEDLPPLRQMLSETYPNYFFALLNYGFGATDMENGLYRLTNATNYLGRYYQPLLSYKPDILVVESFAYNHWSAQAYDLDRQWLTLAKIIDKVKEVSPETKIILAATIGPNTNIYGDGKLNWPRELKWDAALTTRAYLQNLINFATSEHYPLADAYHPSIGADGNGLEAYINQGDHLHPSDAGKLLFSQKIVEAIRNNNLIK